MMNFIERLRKNNFFIKLSLFSSLIIGLFKIVTAILSKSMLLFISSFYNMGIASAKGTFIRKKNSNLLIGLITIVSSIFYIIYSFYIYKIGLNSNYSMIVAILIAAITFTDIVISIIGIIKTNKEEKNIKLVSLATSLISLTLTQTAILSFTNKGTDMSSYNGMCGMLFGIVAMIIGIFIVFNKENGGDKNVKIN